MLTQAFHFQILKDFLDIMNNHAANLCQKLEKNEGEVNIFPLLANCALDTICETAMGCSVGAQDDNESEYVAAVTQSTDLIYQRVMSPWLWSDKIYWCSPQGASLKTCLKVLHEFTDNMVKEKIEQSKHLKAEEYAELVEKNKRMAFLDLLIAAAKENNSLSIEGIREEVDTFMFEGHDTVATNMSFCLYLLAAHPEAQRLCHAELDEIFGDSDRPATTDDLQKMKYMEGCIKESLR